MKRAKKPAHKQQVALHNDKYPRGALQDSSREYLSWLIAACFPNFPSYFSTI